MGSPRASCVLVVLVLLVIAPISQALEGGGDDGDRGPGESRGSWTVRHFEEHKVPVSVDFEFSSENSTYHVAVPNSGKVDAAAMTIEGIARYSLKGEATDFMDNPIADHIGYFSTNGPYPPAQSPSNYQDAQMSPDDEADMGTLDGGTFSTSTPHGANVPPHNHPYHYFDMKVDRTDMVRLEVEWHGLGYCSGNDTYTHGTSVWVWNFTGREWLKLGSYAANDSSGTIHGLSGLIFHPYDFTSRFGHLHILAFGQRDEPGPFFAEIGTVETDYVAVTVYKNDTLQLPQGTEVAIGDRPALWSQSGSLSGEVIIGAPDGLKEELQAYLDTVPPAKGNASIPVVFRTEQATRGLVRVKALTMVVREPDNKPPQFLSAKTVNMVEDVDFANAIDLTDHFDDDIQGSDLDYSVEWEENASAVEAVIVADGHHIDLVTVAEDWAGELAVRFAAMDAWGLTTVSTNFTINVREINDPPVLLDPGVQLLQEDMLYELDVNATDPDLPYGDNLVYSDDTDLFDIDPLTGLIAFTPTQDQVGVHYVNVTVTDARGASNRLTLELRIRDYNDPPFIVDPGLLVATEDEYFAYDFTAEDEDSFATLRWRLVGGVGTLRIGEQNGRLTWIPENEHVGLVPVTVVVRDGQGAASQLNVTIQVLNVNDPPSLDAPPSSQLVEGETFTLALSYHDDDLAVDPGEHHTFFLDPPLFNVSPNGTISVMPANEHVGEHSILITLFDSAGVCATVVWEISVENVNQPPVIELVEDQIWLEGELIHLVIVADDPDVGDVLTFSDQTSMFVIDPDTGVINFTPIKEFVRTEPHEIRITVKDQSGRTDHIVFYATVLGIKHPPVVEIRMDTVGEGLKEGDMVQLTAIATDEDTDDELLTYTWYLDGARVEGRNSLFLRDLRAGTHTVRVVVSDGWEEADATFKFTVKSIKEPFRWGGWVALIVVLVVLFLILRRPEVRGAVVGMAKGARSLGGKKKRKKRRT